VLFGRRKKMCKRLIFVTSVVLLMSLAGKAPAATKTWTGNGDGTDWCDASNWSGGVPGEFDVARFDGTDTVVIEGPGCDDVNVGEIQGPAYEDVGPQVMNIINAEVIVQADWHMVDYDDHGVDDANSTINISGSSVVKVLGGAVRGQDKGIFNLNILKIGNDDPNIYIAGTLRGGDNGNGSFNLYMDGGDVNTHQLRFDESEESTCTVAGGIIIVRNGGIEIPNGEFTLDGGAYVEINGGFTCPGEDEGPGTVNLNSGTLICTGFGNPDSSNWTLDIDAGVTWLLRGSHLATIQTHITEGRITGKDGTEPPLVVEFLVTNMDASRF
jgi:hypothetical protein